MNTTALFLILVSSANALPKSSMSETKFVMKSQLAPALEKFHTDCRRYPSTEEGLRALIKKPKECPNWGPSPYLKNENQTKDGWGHRFNYSSRSNCRLA
ncbi:MAG: type II secretion system protein GspG [Bdellovibrionales bacterium]|nr:type II secretion system protein GspG [Bdellovibrionales bacterium]